MFEFLFELLIEIVGQIIFEGLTTLGWESLKHSGRRERRSNPVLAAIGHFLMGLCAGVLSLFIIGRRLTPHSPLTGISLVLSPIGTGIAMHWMGEFWRERGRDRPALFSFRAGAIFAFGMALVRFVYLER
jgi:MFS family permease